MSSGPNLSPQHVISSSPGVCDLPHVITASSNPGSSVRHKLFWHCRLQYRFLLLSQMESQCMCVVCPLRTSSKLCIIVRETSEVTACVSRDWGATPHLLAAIRAPRCALQVHADCGWLGGNMRNRHDTRNSSKSSNLKEERGGKAHSLSTNVLHQARKRAIPNR